jgi:hypothetical protein
MANGFGNRFLWFVVKSDKVMARTRPIPDDVLEPFAERLKAWSHFATNDTVERPVPLNADARELWETVYPQLRTDRPGLAGAMVSRGPTMVLRLALIYAVLECPARRDGLYSCYPVVKGLAIHREHLEAALAVWDYCKQSAYQLFGEKSGDPLGDKLLKLLEAGPLTKEELNTHLSNGQKAGVGAVLARLEAAGLVRRGTATREGRGRPATRWERV